MNSIRNAARAIWHKQSGLTALAKASKYGAGCGAALWVASGVRRTDTIESAWDLIRHMSIGATFYASVPAIICYRRMRGIKAETNPDPLPPLFSYTETRTEK